MRFCFACHRKDKNMKIRSFILLLITAAVWGFGFVAQSEGMEYVGPFTFTCIRSILGGLVLIPVLLIRENLQKKKCSRFKHNQINISESRQYGMSKLVLISGVCSGILLAIAQNLQQIGVCYTSVGKAGFITAMYIILVPILGLFFRKRTSPFVWFGVAFAVIGLYLLNMTGNGEGLRGFQFGKGEIAVLLCALFFALQILVIDYFSSKVDVVKMACIQFFVCGIVSGILMIPLEHPQIPYILNAGLPILYAGIGSTGIGYTLQILGQKDLNPTVASLVMSLESVFAVVGGFLILHEYLSVVELIGCGCMMAAIILAQLPETKMGRNHKMGSAA